MSLSPIAITGQSCILPGALSPDALWTLVLEGRDEVRPAPPGHWRVQPEDVAARGTSAAEAVDGAWSTMGGYVSGFDRAFDPGGFGMPEDEVLGLDPLFQWVLHGAREALAGAALSPEVRARAGVFLGNLSYPSEGMARFGESVILERQPELLRARARAFLDRPDARNRFMSGLPAHLCAAALGLGGPALALDAACASALYAIKLGCDALRDGRLDAVVVGAVNRADDLFLHIGFSALTALSKTGRSRPFHREADGLIPAEGAAFVVLRRLDDAVRAGEPVLGVIRGVGLSNDGRGGGLLTPSVEGQVRALRAAYAEAGVPPESVDLLECHATGTPVGDRTELETVTQVFGAHRLGLGSLKANLGHLITAAGLAGLLKVLGALRHRTLPPGRAQDALVDPLQGGSLRLLTAPEPWEARGPRRACVNAFGFGGNNAHLVVEEAGAPDPGPSSWVLPEDEIVVVGLGVVAADAAGADAFARAWLSEAPRPGVPGRTEQVSVPLTGLRSPPNDLKSALAQQNALLQAASEATAGVAGLDREATGVLAGMGTDAEVVRHGLRWRLQTYARRWLGEDPPPGWVAEAKAATEQPLTAAGVVGAMPNIVANRLNHQLDLAGPSFSVSAEEASGTRALGLAIRALRAGELDAAVVGAVDFACDPIHAEAAAMLGLPTTPGDAAVCLVLQRSKDAARLGNRALAAVSLGRSDGEAVVFGEGGHTLRARFGEPHAASGLLHVAAAALSVAHGALPAQSAPAPQPWLRREGEHRAAEVRVQALGGQRDTLSVRSVGPALPLQTERTRLILRFAGPDRAAVLRAMAEGRTGGEGPFRVAVAAPDEARRQALLARATAVLEAGGLPWGDGIWASEAPMEGELAFLFTGAAGPYAGMGSALLTAFPQLAERVRGRLADLPDAIWPDTGVIRSQEPHWQMVYSSVLGNVHATFTQEILGLRPTASVGYSLGESSAMHALGVWDAITPMMREILSAPLFTNEVAGNFEAVRRVWRRQGFAEADHPGPIWENWSVRASGEDVERVLGEAPLCRLLLINAPDEVVLGGWPPHVRRVVERLGAPAAPLGYGLAVHCPEVLEVAESWLDYHRRPTNVVPVRFYSAAWCRAYQAEPETVAQAMLGHAAATLDFPALVRKAWEDGVRIFVEHGPRGLAASWVRRSLGDRPHLTVSLDAPDKPGLLAVAEAIGQLWVAGVSVRDEALATFDVGAPARAPAPALVLPGHPPEVLLPALPAPRRPEAPALPPLLELPAEEPTEVAVKKEATEIPVHTSTPPRPAASTSLAVSALLQAQAQVAEVHRQFLSAQATAHQRWLSLATQRPAPPSPRPVAAAPVAVAAPVPLAPSTPAPAAPAPSIPAPAAPPVAAAPAFPGPKLDRADLEYIARGPISHRLGPVFERQDGFARQVRMPAPPLLLCDRVLGIDVPPGELRPSTIWTETDVTWDAWYLHEGVMPPGVMIEAGQADLLLVSWLGIDFLNQGERVYRLLGCNLSWHGPAPVPGETLHYEIHIDGFASHGDVRLFFFRYDCTVNGELRLRVRGGQAGFFTDAELDDSEGVIWSAEDAKAELVQDPHLDAPLVPMEKTTLSKAELAAFAAGDLESCFGPAFWPAHAHVRTPRIAGGRMLMIDRVVELSARGGPWGRGYLKAEQDLSPDAWFFDGHFHGDPCMPGTLMLEVCVQTLALYLASHGVTLSRDGWRFQPVRGQVYPMRCRGQATPKSRLVTYEVFVEQLWTGPEPRLIADVMVSVDGLAAFHCRRLGLELVPDWPLTSRPDWLAEAGRDPNAGLPKEPPAQPFDAYAVLASAVGRPSDAFGAPYTVFDGARRAPRLPGPPYHLMTTIRSVDAPQGSMKSGAVAEVAYTVPPDAWYFAEGRGIMPFAVLCEVALQPCGWLASWLGCALGPDDVFFRNLDGVGTLHAHVRPDAGELVTRTKLIGLSRLGAMTLVNFELEVRGRGGPIYTLRTGFGFFPEESLKSQAGLPAEGDERAFVTGSGEALTTFSRAPEAPGAWQRGLGGLPSDRLLMLDRIVRDERSGGRHGRGRLLAEHDVDPRAWFFKAHFFQDPVQPGSLGLDAMYQLVRYAALQHGAQGSLQPLLGAPMSWKYRGQVRPHNRRVSVILDLAEAPAGAVAAGDAALWVDGLRIYEATGLALMRG